MMDVFKTGRLKLIVLNESWKISWLFWKSDMKIMGFKAFCTKPMLGNDHWDRRGFKWTKYWEVICINMREYNGKEEDDLNRIYLHGGPI